jgi:tetratricopeptide (TPR) repeat protein
VTETTTTIESSFAGWLYRPYIDLGEWRAHGDPITIGLELAARAVSEGRDDYARLNGLIPPSARRAIVTRSGFPQYAVDDPQELPSELRSRRWQDLCDQLAVYPALDPDARMRVLWLLHRLCMHSAVLRYENDRPASAGAFLPPDEADRRYMRGMSTITLFRDGEMDVPDLSELEAVAALATAGTWAHIEATYLLAQFHLKDLGDKDAFVRYLDVHKAAIDAADVDDHRLHKILSRYHRVRAFLPHFNGDMPAMTHEMDLAEYHCDLMRRDDVNTTAEWCMLRSALLESRTKERLVRGDLDGAERYALELIRHVPADPHPWLELGQVRIEQSNIEGAVAAYQWASLLGPAVTHISDFMLGQCLEKLGRMDEARVAYLRSLAADPLGISTARRVEASGLNSANELMRIWSRGHLLRLTELDEGKKDSLREYQKYAGVLGRA